MKAYKAMNRDLMCRDVEFKEGEIYEVNGSPILCRHGFHFCKDLVLTLAYYPADDITDNCYAEVEILGEVKFEQPTKHKGVTNKIKILRIIPDNEVRNMVDGNWNSGDLNSGDLNSGNKNSGDLNSGAWNSGNGNSGAWNSGNGNSGNKNSGDLNSGDLNSGYRNSGYRNSGNKNSGYRNSGNKNSGDWNSCDQETGMFNTKQSDTIRVFNKPCKRKIWDETYKPAFLYFQQKEGMTYKEAFVASWNEADKKDREKVRDLPNFDANAFYELSGIDLR